MELIEKENPASLYEQLASEVPKQYKEQEDR